MKTITGGRTTLDPFPYIVLPLHTPTFLSAKQFEELYWPTFRDVIYQVNELGGKAFIALEGHWEHLYDFVNDFPKDFAIAQLEKDDIFKAKDKIGKNVTILGGFNTALLRSDSKQECLDDVKKVMDKCAPGGGFIFSTDTTLIAPNDVNPENYAAVTNFVHTNGKY